MLANTKDLKYGLLTQEVISSKPLMLLPNLPRFVRQGDEVSISTQVINNSKEAVSGRVRIELFDPATDQPIICLSKSQRPFELQPDSIATVSWIIPVPKQISLLGVRILADSEKGSDGEQQIVPVLSNQLLITESTPFYLLKEGEKQIRISGNSEGATPFQMCIRDRCIYASPLCRYFQIRNFLPYLLYRELINTLTRIFLARTKHYARECRLVRAIRVMLSLQT